MNRTFVKAFLRRSDTLFAALPLAHNVCRSNSIAVRQHPKADGPVYNPDKVFASKLVFSWF